MKQSPPALSLQEGANSTLCSNFPTSPQSVNWYLKNPGGHLINLVYIPSGTKQDGRLKGTTVLIERHSLLHMSPLQTTDSITSVSCSTVLPRHLQCVLKPFSEPSSSSSHSHIMRPPRAFAVLSISYLHWYSYNHKHFSALQIWDLVFSLLNLYLLLH